ncbi:MAG: hypothetical protein QW728_07265, partial [Thermoplasmata archaeon]
MIENILIKNRYVDSVVLMSITGSLKKIEGVSDVHAMMGSPENKDILSGAGVLTEIGKTAGPSDIIITFKSNRAGVEKEIEKAVLEFLNKTDMSSGAKEEVFPSSLRSALERMPDANLLLLSIPGRYVRREADIALDAGLHVMSFSDNVPLEDEIALKKKAFEKGLLFMGPDCGTSMISGVGLAFANLCRRGKVGIIGASGTGIQEVSTIVHKQGGGISHAIGLGGRDLKEEVGGLSMLLAMDALQEDPDTEVLVLISKPPSKNVMEKVLKKAAEI